MGFLQLLSRSSTVKRLLARKKTPRGAKKTATGREAASCAALVAACWCDSLALSAQRRKQEEEMRWIEEQRLAREQRRKELVRVRCTRMRSNL